MVTSRLIRTLLGSTAAVALTAAVGCGGSADSPETPGATDDAASAQPVGSSQAQAEGGIEMFPLTDRSAPTPTLFARLDPEATGVDLINILDTEHPRDYLYHSGFACGGIAIGDVNGDGKPDLFFSRGPDGMRCISQRGRMQFEDVSEAAGITGATTIGRAARRWWISITTATWTSTSATTTPPTSSLSTRD